jgi:hypothetical protein
MILDNLLKPLTEYVFEYNLKESEENTNVFVSGSFNNWKKIKMNKDGNKFFHKAILKFGEYEYKFFVNNEWKYINSLPITITEEGYINNYLRLSNNCDIDTTNYYNIKVWHL